MEAVKAFTFELYSIMEMKPPISKAKMTAITRNAIKAIKLYKHVVQCVEKFIQKCKPEYKIPGLYVIDSIVRQSRHQFGNDKDVFAPRFARNLRSTFTHLFSCPEEDKSKVIRVLNLWQKNAVFTTDIIQPIFDLAANPDYSENSHVNPLSTMDNSPKLSVKTDLFKSQENTPVKDDMSKSFDALQSQNMENDNKPIDPAILEHIQAIQSLLKKQPGQLPSSPQVKKSDGVKLFDKKILDYDYGDDEEEMLNQSPEFQHQHQNTAIEGLDSLLSNPEVLRTLRNVEGLMSTQSKQQAELDKIKEMRKEAEFDKHLAQTVQNLPFASECELKPSPMVPQTVNMMSNPFVNQLYNTQNMYQQQQSLMALDVHHKSLPQIISYDDPNQSKPEVIDLDHIASPPHNKRDSRRDGYSSSTSRKRSPRKSSRERQREREKDRERDRERRKKYLPPLKKNHLAVVSTTLWVGHLSKLIHQDDLYGLFQPIGDIVSLNLISPRGCAFLCMNRRQDAARIMSKYQGERLQGKPMTIAWAPGQAMKDKEWKDYWEIDDGVSYIPWEKLNKEIDYDELEVGGMLDEDTMPEWLKTHLKNLRTSKKNEKKEEEKLTDGNQQPLTASNFFDTQGVQSPSVQMQMSPSQNSQPNQINFNMPQTMSMPNPFGINPRLINPMMNPMMPGTMAPMSMGHPSMMMMNRMPSPFGPPPNMAMMGNPQQMTITSDAQKSLGVPTDMMMSFPFGINLPSQAAAISSAQTMMGMNPSIVTSGTSTAPTLSHTSQKDNLITTNPPNQLDPSTVMQFNLPPPPTLPNLSNFSQNINNSNMGNEKYDLNTLGNSDQEESKDTDRNIEREDRNRGRDNRNRSRDSRERIDRFKDRENKNDRGRRDDLPRLDPRNRTEQRERKSSRWGDKVNEEVDSQNNVGRLSVKEGLSLAQAPNLAQIDNVKDILIQNNSLHQILEHVIQDNMGNPPFQPPGMFGPNGPLPNQIFNMPPQSFPQGLGQDGPKPPLMDNGNLRGRGGWNRGGRGGFRGRGGFNNGPNWDNNNGPNWDNSSGPNWDSNAPPPVWQNQSINRGGMMGRGNLRPPLMQNVMGRGRDNWIDNNSSGGRGGRDTDNWGGRGGRDTDKWGGRGGNRDSDGWGGRGSRPSPWRGNGNRRRNDDWENPNHKRWRRDDNSEYDEQPKVWKRGAVNEEEEWQNNKQGPQWLGGKKDEGNYSKFKSRENNEERPRKPSKWGDRDSDETVKEDRWNRKSVSKDESIIDEGPHQTSAPMDLDNYESDTVDNIEQLHGDQEHENSNLNQEIRQQEEFVKEDNHEIIPLHESGDYNDTVTHDQAKNNVQQNVDEECYIEHQQLKDNQDNFSNNLQELPPHDNIEEKQQNSDCQRQDNFESQNMLDEKYDEYHNDYQKNSHGDTDSKQDHDQMSQNNRELEQNQQFETECNNMMYDTKSSNYNQSYDEESSHKLNSQEHSTNNFVFHANNETDEVRYEEKSHEPQDNLYFDTVNELSLNKPIEIEQQDNEEIGIIPADNNIVPEVNTAESNQS